MTLLAPIGSDEDHLFGVTFDIRIDSLHSKKCQPLRLTRMPTCLLDGSVRKVRNKSVLHFSVTIRAAACCHCALHIQVEFAEVRERTPGFSGRARTSNHCQTALFARSVATLGSSNVSVETPFSVLSFSAAVQRIPPTCDWQVLYNFDSVPALRISLSQARSG